MDTAGGDAGAADQPEGEATPAAFLQDPVAFLSAIAVKPPSQQSMDQLGGPVSKWFVNKSAANKESSVSPVAAAYLQAAAVHLQETALPAGNAMLEAVATKKEYEVVTAVGVCATLCMDRRGAITGSGILPTLGNLVLNSQTQNANQLSQVGVEFLQCALLAEQYRYAARLVDGTWPRPDMTVNVKLVLRYYYLRGMIHLGCNDFVMAHRCFWTCLSVPAEVCCKIAVEAWKKLVLVQCLMNDGTDPENNKTSLPKSLPTCMGRLLTSSKEAASFTSSFSEAKGSGGTKRSQPSKGFLGSMNEQVLSQTRSSKKSKKIDTESTACYMDIVDAFYKRDKTRLESLIVEQNATLQSDGNFGLVQQCHTQLINNQVRHISKMYSVVSVSKAATLLGIDSSVSGDAASQQVVALLCRSGVPCEVHEDGMIIFGNDDDQENSTTVTSSLVDLAEWMTLLEKVQRLDVNILTSARYQTLVRKELVSGGAAKAAAALSAGPRGVDDI